jgi:long-chain acyl-CoA synthetase
MEYSTVTPVGALHQEIDDNNVDTMDKVFAHAIAKNGDRNCLGSRDIISEEEFLDNQTGKMMKKYELGEYNWVSYREAENFAKHLSGGFAALGVQPKGKIAILAETRKEWMLTAMGAFKRSLQGNKA